MAPSDCQESSLSLASRVEHFQKLCSKLERLTAYYNLNMLNGCPYTTWPVQEIMEHTAVSEEPSMPTRESESEDIGCDYAWQDQGEIIQAKISGIISVNCIL